MTRWLVPLLAVIAASPVWAAERTVTLSSFEKLRVDGPFEVRIVTGASPGVKLSGDRELIERVAVQANGASLTIRLGNGGWGERFASANNVPPVLTVSTPRLTNLAIAAGTRATANRLKGQQVAVSVHGTGSLVIDRVEADQFTASLLGAGALTVSGEANRARLVSDGTPTIDASRLMVKDLDVQLSGLGETSAFARQTASVISNGLGKVMVRGPATCTVRAIAGGPVVCGSGK